ncbi:MAG: magnesium and cobalt transport protein CorA [Burkholderiales bacterium]
MGMVVNCIAYKNGARLGAVTIEDISEVLKQDGTFIWLGLHEPDEPLLNEIREEFGLHELAIEDAHNAHQRPKLEEYGDSLFVVLHTAQLLENSIKFGETHIFVGRRFLVSVRHGPSLSYAKVRERCELATERLAQGPGFALYSIMDFVVDNYRPIVDSLHERLEIIEADIFKQRFSRDSLQDLYELRRQLVLLQAAAEPLLDICNTLIRFHTDIIPKEARAYFRDIHDHVKGVTQATNSMREMLTIAMQVNLALVTVGQNEVVKKLAGWGAILAIPTMVFSLYGMNFEHMPELNWKFSYPIVLILTVMGCIAVHRRLKRAKWL